MGGALYIISGIQIQQELKVFTQCQELMNMVRQKGLC
jgi:hypothetical protein